MPSKPLSRQAQTKLSHGDILNVVLVYAVFAALWILLSDKTIEWLISDPAQITVVSIVKGWFYIAITSLLLYSLMHRWVDRESMPITPTAGSRRLVLLFVLLAAMIVALTGAGIIHTFIQHKKTALTRIQAGSEFKAQQINDWLRERQADADFIQSSFYFAEQYQLWQRAGNLQSGARIKSRLEQFCKDWRFAGVTLLNPKGETLWKSDKAPTIVPTLQRTIQLAAANRKVLRVAPYRDSVNNVRLDFVVPLPLIPNPAPSVILHVNMEDWLFPILQSWPFPATPNKMLVFRVDNNQVIYFNEPRNINETIAKPFLSETGRQQLTAHLPSADSSRSNAIEAMDDRGMQLIAMVTAIPGTDWFLLSKLNRSRMYQEAFSDIALVGFVGFLSLFISVAGFYLLRQNQHLILAQAVHKSQTERLSALNLLATIADSSDDAIFAKDLEGRYIMINRASCRFIGKQSDEMLGKDDRSIFPEEQAEMLMEFGRRVIAENRVQTAEEVLDTKHGERIFLATKGPLRDSEGNTIGIFGISRDITEIKQVEKSLRDSEERFRLALDATNDGLWDWDLRSGRAYFSPHYYKISGYRADEVTPDFNFFKRMVHPEDLADVLKTITAHRQGITPICECDYRLVTRQGDIKWMRARGKVVERDGEGQPNRMIGTITDISSLKFAEESLHRQTEELAKSNIELERFNRSMVGRELDMIALKQQVNELSRQLGQKPPFVLSFLDTSASNNPDQENTA